MALVAPRFFLVLLSLPLAACGPVQGNAPDDEPASGPSAHLSSQVGDLLAFQAPLGLDRTTFVFSGRFGDTTASAGEQPAQVSDACELRVLLPNDTLLAADPIRLPHAGQLTVTSGPLSRALGPDGLGVYSDAELEQAPSVWDRSSELAVSAAGHDVPAFRVSARPPPALRVKLPRMDRAAESDSATAFVLDRDAPAAFSWEPAEVGVVHLQISSGDPSQPARPPEPVRVLECTWPASDGFGEIPSYALSLHPAGQASIRAYVHTSGHAQAGDFDVTLTLVQDAAFTGVEAGEVPLIALR